jgi:hypothetical protein
VRGAVGAAAARACGRVRGAGLRASRKRAGRSGARTAAVWRGGGAAVRTAGAARVPELHFFFPKRFLCSNCR